MQVLLTIATLFGLTAVFSYINERFLKLQQTIGLMLMALALTLVLMLLNLLSLSEYFAQEQEFVARLSLDETLLNGVLCFILFAGSINVDIRTLREERWVILTLAIGATLIAAVLIGLAVLVLYCVIGGMVAGVYTDLLQGGLMLLTAVAAVFLIPSETGPAVEAPVPEDMVRTMDYLEKVAR